MRVGLRHSRFAGLRDDRDPREVVKEHAEGAAEVVMSSNLARVGANRGKSASSDQTCRVNFSFGIQLLFAVCCALPRFA
jgi:hypothetical protein